MLKAHVPDPKTIHLLMVEDSLEDEQFLRETVNEIIEAPQWPNWHACELMTAGDLFDASALLSSQRFEAILLDLSLPDARTLLDAFLVVRSAAPDTPILILADYEDDALAHTLLREGAQDVLLKRELDSGSLARSLRYAMERHRRISALQSLSFFDELTGLYNRRGYAAFAAHDLQCAKRRGEPLLIAAIDLLALSENDSFDGREHRDLTLIRAGELLRSCFGSAAILGRIGDRRFGICTSAATEGGVEYTLDGFERHLWHSKNGSRNQHGIRIGAVTFSPQYPADFADLLAEAESRLDPRPVLIAP